MEPHAVRDQVFISYSKGADAAFVRFLAKALRAVPFRVWLDEEQIPAGDDFERRLQEALVQSRQAVFVVSPQWLKRDWTRYESKTFSAIGADRRRVAVLRFPRGEHMLGPELDLLHNVQWVDGRDDQASCFWQLVCGLTGEAPGPAEDWPVKGKGLLDRVQSPPVPAAASVVPVRPAPDPRDRDGLYLSCDRGNQWSYLTVRMREAQHQIILLPGERGEAHDEFINRIESQLPTDPPRRIVKVDWVEYPCPRQAELLLADFALALGVDESALSAALADELGYRHIVLLQPTLHCFGQAPLDYLTKVLPQCLREATALAWRRQRGPQPDQPRYAVKVVQPVEWPRWRLAGRLWASLKGALAGLESEDAAEASAFMERLTKDAAPDLPVRRLPTLTRITKDDLEAFCVANGLPLEKRKPFIAQVLHDAHSSRDVLFNVQRLFPTMELA